MKKEEFTIGNLRNSHLVRWEIQNRLELNRSSYFVLSLTALPTFMNTCPPGISSGKCAGPPILTKPSFFVYYCKRPGIL